MLDGVDLRELSLADLRRNLAPVLQETLVFDGTVRDNILWGRPEARERDVVAAAIAADAHEFISALPDGYDTRIGQRGRMLSGGQRQRLAIARAMIRNAPVLLLDEPTTGLDAGSTERVLAPLRRLMEGRTSIMISHNLLTVTDADPILFLEQGRILGAGTHEQLLASPRGYAQLYRLHHQRQRRARTGGPAFRPPHPRRPAEASADPRPAAAAAGSRTPPSSEPTSRPAGGGRGGRAGLCRGRTPTPRRGRRRLRRGAPPVLPLRREAAAPRPGRRPLRRRRLVGEGRLVPLAHPSAPRPRLRVIAAPGGFPGWCSRP